MQQLCIPLCHCRYLLLFGSEGLMLCHRRLSPILPTVLDGDKPNMAAEGSKSSVLLWVLSIAGSAENNPHYLLK